MATNREIIEILVKVRDEASKRLMEVNKVVKKNGQTTKQFDDRLRNLNKTNSQLNSLTKKSKREFAGWAMSIMFFGMAIKRVFDQVWKFGTKTFNDVMHSVEGTVTGFDMMQGSLKFLGFQIGQALEPVVMWLVPIIDKISEWVSKNQSLVAGLLVTIGTLGTLFFLIGTGKLALDGFIVAAEKLGSTKIASSLGFMSTPAFLAGAGAVVAIAGASWVAFSKTPEAWRAVKDSLAEIDFTPLKDSMVELINTVFPDMDVSWSGFAWTLAWFNDIYKGFINAYISYTASFVDAIDLIISSLLAVNDAMTYTATFGLVGNKDAIRESLSSNKAKLASLVSNFKDATSSIGQSFSTLTMTVDEFKTATLEAQKAADAATTSSTSSLKGSYLGGYSTNLPQSRLSDLYSSGSSSLPSTYGNTEQSVAPTVNVYIDSEPIIGKVVTGINQSTWTG